MKRLCPIFFAAIALIVTASVSSAQSVEDSRAGVSRLNLVSANPIGLLFQWYNGEFEHAMSATASLAIAGSSYDFEDARYSSVDGIVRYYPGARALRGFSVGASAGFVDMRDDNSCIEFGCEDQSGTAGTIGVRADYVWILGRDQHFSAEAGIGAKRILSNQLGTEGLPIGRLSIGYAW
ncbi:MAG: DUF3575 domain-containing protein [Gemmatimonadales bacterium]